VMKLNDPRIDISLTVPFKTWDDLAAARADPASAGAGPDAEAVEGVMLKRRDAPYVPGRPKGPWWKWKRDPLIIDAVLMYAQRGHGKRSSYYSDYTFGVWTKGESGEELVPVGKAYFGFTDAELIQIDRFVRRNTVDRFGPVREVAHESNLGLVLEVAFDGLQRSTRHKSGIAMRFPRINRLRWDKPPGEADRLETLEKMLVLRERARVPVNGGGHGLQSGRALGGRVPIGSAAASDFVVDFGRRDPLCARPRSIRHYEEYRAANPIDLEYGLRRTPLAVALFPARSGDRHPDLAHNATDQRAARTLGGPAFRGDRGGVAADHRCE